MKKRFPYFKWPDNVQVLPYEQAVEGLSDYYRIIPDGELTEKERFLVGFLRTTYQRCFNWDDHPRRLVVGESDIAEAWTDGSTYIALRRDHVAQADHLKGWLYIAELIHHEQTHQDPTTEQHLHTPEFYPAFHDTALQDGFIRNFVEYAVATFPAALDRAGRILTQKQAKTFDKLVRAGHKREAIYERMQELARLNAVAAEIQKRSKAKPSTKANTARRKAKNTRNNSAKPVPHETTKAFQLDLLE